MVSVGAIIISALLSPQLGHYLLKSAISVRPYDLLRPAILSPQVNSAISVQPYYLLRQAILAPRSAILVQSCDLIWLAMLFPQVGHISLALLSPQVGHTVILTWPISPRLYYHIIL